MRCTTTAARRTFLGLGHRLTTGEWSGCGAGASVRAARCWWPRSGPGNLLPLLFPIVVGAVNVDQCAVVGVTPPNLRQPMHRHALRSLLAAAVLQVMGPTFADVPSTPTFYRVIESLVAHGIVAGYPCGAPGEPCLPPGTTLYFRPATSTTRAQLSKILWLKWAYG